jgi:hypothetical protein
MANTNSSIAVEIVKSLTNLPTRIKVDGNPIEGTLYPGGVLDPVTHNASEALIKKAFTEGHNPTVTRESGQ